jgi:hypothetical protein
MYKCRTTITGTSQQIMGAAGRSLLQDLLGSYTENGVWLNEPLTAHSGGAGQRWCTAIKHAYLKMRHRHHRRQPVDYGRSGA